MYENMTFENIMQKLLSSVERDIDKREGSMIYTALAPAAVEIQNMYIQLDWILDQSFADTAQREFLIKRCSERGIYPNKATKAVLKGEFNIDIPIGSRFSFEMLSYTVIEKIDDKVFKLACDIEGKKGHQQLGNIIPIDYIEGLTTAELVEVLIPGEDEESTEELRKRFFNSLESQAFGGNIADYKTKTKDIDGVGSVKVYPVWNGGGTVKLVILDSFFNIPSDDLIDKVQNIIDPTVNKGQGVGIAPIGHEVTVNKASGTVIDISTEITYQDGWDYEDIKPSISRCIDSYFNSLASTWENSENLVVRISHIETRLLGLEGILDIANTTLNGEGKNLILEVNSIPIRGEVNG